MPLYPKRVMEDKKGNILHYLAIYKKGQQFFDYI